MEMVLRDLQATPTFAASPAASWDEARNSANGVTAGVSAKAGEVFARFGTKVRCVST